MRLLTISLCSALSSCLSQFLCVLLSSNFWNFSLRPVDGCEQYTPWCYVRVAFPCPCTDKIPPASPESLLSTHPCTHTHSPFSHPSIRSSIFLPTAPWPKDSNGNPFYLLISVVGVHLSPVCVCIRFRPSVYDLSQEACDNQTQGRGDRKRDNNKE